METELQTATVKKILKATLHINITLPIIALIIERLIDPDQTIKGEQIWLFVFLDVFLLGAYIVFLTSWNLYANLRLIEEVVPENFFIPKILLIIAGLLIPFNFQAMLITITSRINVDEEKFGRYFGLQYILTNAGLIIIYLFFIHQFLIRHSFVFQFLNMTIFFEWMQLGNLLNFISPNSF